jgi:hypothetical protein
MVNLNFIQNEVLLADKPWQKVLLADLLWEKNIAEPCVRCSVMVHLEET